MSYRSLIQEIRSRVSEEQASEPVQIKDEFRYIPCRRLPRLYRLICLLSWQIRKSLNELFQEAPTPPTSILTTFSLRSMTASWFIDSAFKARHSFECA